MRKLSNPARRILAYMVREAAENRQSHHRPEDLRDVVIGSGHSAGARAIGELLIAGLITRAGELLWLTSKGGQGA